MDNEKEMRQEEHADLNSVPEGSGKNNGAERPTRGLEGFYENFRGVPLKYLDAFIVICVVLLIAVIAFGVLQARG